MQFSADGSPMFVALCPKLDVGSQGETIELAVANLREAIAGVLEIADAAEIRQRLQNGAIVQTLEVDALSMAA